MEKFVKPEMEIKVLTVQDILTVSTMPVIPETVAPCETKDCSVYGTQW